MKLDDIIQAVEPMLNEEARAEMIRRRRVRLLTSNQSPMVLATGCRAFSHLIPHRQNMLINFNDPNTEKIFNTLGYQLSTSNSQYNFDGLRRYAPPGQNVSRQVQYFRSGIIEMYRVFTSAHDPVNESHELVYGNQLRAFILDNLSENMKALTELGFEFPYRFSVTILGAKGCVLAVNQYDQGIPIDRDELWPEGIQLEAIPQSVEMSLLPCLNAIWSSSGIQYKPESGDGKRR